MKVLSLMQPWATLVAIGAKNIETRSWGTTHLGALAIHASKTFPKGGKKAFDELCGTEPFKSVLTMHTEEMTASGHLSKLADYIMPRGAIIAICNLVECVKITDGFLMEEPERSFGNFTPGRFAWFLKDISMLNDPIRVRGSLGIWHWSGKP